LQAISRGNTFFFVGSLAFSREAANQAISISKINHLFRDSMLDRVEIKNLLAE